MSWHLDARACSCGSGSASRLTDGRVIDLPFVRALLQQELTDIRARFTLEQLQTMQLHEAATLFESLVAQEDFAEFLTLPVHERLTASNVSKE